MTARDPHAVTPTGAAPNLQAARTARRAAFRAAVESRRTQHRLLDLIEHHHR